MKAGVAGHAPLAEAIKSAGTGETLSFAQQLGRMFSVDLPKVDASLLSTAAEQWKSFWLLPAGMAAVIAVLFFIAFWDKSADGGDANH
jgi:hypothetical protein